MYCSGETVPWHEIVSVEAWLGSVLSIEQQPHLTSQTLMAPSWKDLRAEKEGQNQLALLRRLGEVCLVGIIEFFLAGHALIVIDPRDKLFAPYIR